MVVENGYSRLDKANHAEEKTEKIKKVLKTCALVIVWVVFGMDLAIIAPTLSDLSKRFEADQQQMALAFLAASMGNVVGGPLSILIDKFYGHIDLIIGLSLVINGLLLMMKPIFPNLIVLGILGFIEHMLFTVINSAGNAIILALWGENCAAPMQALHFGFPLGAMIGPLIAYPFVTHDIELDNATIPQNTTAGKRFTWLPDFPDDSEIEIAYWIIGITVLAVGIAFMFFQCFKTPSTTDGSKDPKEVVTSTLKQILSTKNWSPLGSKFGVVILSCMCAYYVLHVATSASFWTYHALYPIDANFTNEQEATVLSSTFHLTGTIARALGIFAAKFISVNKLITIVVLGEALAAISMPILGLYNKTAYWTICCIFGFIMEPTWPCGYTWTNQFIVLLAVHMGISGGIAAIAYAFIGWVCGYTYTHVSIQTIFYLSAGFGVVFFIHVVLMNVYAIPKGIRFKAEPEERTEVELSLLENEE